LGKSVNRSGPQLGGFLLPSDLGLVHAEIHQADQGFVESGLKILGSRADAPITELRQLCGTGQRVFGLGV
jgi:hypothetical protein